MSKLIEFKASSLSAMTAHIRELDNVRLADTLHAMLGGMGEFFAGEATVIDLSQAIKQPEKMDWTGLLSLLRRYGLQPVAVKGLAVALIDSARKAGLAILDDSAIATRPNSALASAASSASASSASASASSSSASSGGDRNKAHHQVNSSVHSSNTMIIDRPVRSGQQIYARGTDLVVIGGVSNGAEIIADGSIHCYGPLRGRALAGAQGNTAARLFCTNFGPELVSIAGVYRTFEGGIPANLAGRPSMAQLRAKDGESQPSQLTIEALMLD